MDVVDETLLRWVFELSSVHIYVYKDKGRATAHAQNFATVDKNFANELLPRCHLEEVNIQPLRGRVTYDGACAFVVFPFCAEAKLTSG